MNFILYDDLTIRHNLLPLTYTRPIGELRLGYTKIREKWERHLNQSCSWLTEPYLQTKFPVISAKENILINSAVLPGDNLVNQIYALKKGEALKSGDTIIAFFADRENLTRPENHFLEGYSVKTAPEPHKIFRPYHIFSLNAKAIKDDFNNIRDQKMSAELSNTNTVIQSENIFVEEGATVENVSLNASHGPIYIGKNAEIMEGALIRGPLVLADNATIKMGAKIYGPTTIGPCSKVGGEIKNSVIQGYSNKAHEGFIGNSVIGEWCNFGADTNNSNLKNNYGEVKLWNYTEEDFSKTGFTFCGLIMGDHSKCGINTMFNTGTVVGVSANIYGGGFQNKFIPSFSWGGANEFTTFQFSKALDVAKTMVHRRGNGFNAKDEAILSEIYNRSAKYRQ